MMVLDTNVLSELMRPFPSEQVLQWLDAQNPEDLAVTAITMAEIWLGIAKLPAGKRKAVLTEAARIMFEEEFAERILAFDEHAALSYASFVSKRESLGRPLGMADAQIAAICQSHGASLATRNLKDFDRLGLTLINPWELGS